MIKIEFDFDLGNVPASAKKFAEYLRGIETTSKETGDQLKKLGDGIDRTSEKMTKAGNSIKKSNQQWTSFALVIQDLPYGFRGIQNNLPALVGGIAGAAGPIYLIASALIAFTTAYEKEIASFIYGINAVDSAQQKLNVAISDGIGVAKAETATNAALLIVINDVNKSTTDRTEALDLLKEKYKGNIDLQKTDIDDGKSLIEITNKISEALLRKARAEAFSKLIAEEEAKIFKLQAEQGEQVVKNLGFLETSYQVLKSVGNVATTSLNVTTAAFNKQGKEITKAQGNVTLFTNKLNENTLAQVENNDAATLSTAAPKKDNRAKERLKAIENANDAETKAYITTLDERGKKEYEAGLELAKNLQAMRDAGYTDSTTYYAAYRAEMDKIDIYYNNKQIEEARKTAEKLAKDAEVIDNRNLQNSLDALKIESDVAMKIANASGKTTATDRIAILEDYKNSLYELASTGGYTAEQFDKIDDALKRVDGAIEGSKDRIKDYSVTWQETANTINGILTSLVRDSIANFAENIGKAFAGEKVDIFGGFLELLSNGLQEVGKALIAYGIAMDAFKKAFKNPYAAIAAGIALVAVGSLLKSKISKTSGESSGGGGATAFANGGIVSGPTMGLIGEYPGARTNPEVVAPLDKLKDMIGGNGGGSFVLRGTDLVLALNRSETSLNLRRGS